MKGLVLSIAVLTVLSFAAYHSDPVSSQRATAKATPTPTPDAIDRNTSTPYDGDLSIFENAQRDKDLQIDRVMDILKINGDKTVADIGAGSGWFTVRAAKRTTGKVFAVEINQEYINHIKKRAAREKLPNITTVLGKFDDPVLPKDSIDAVLILKTYHEIEKPITFMKNLRPALKTGALVGIIDKNGSGDDHGLDRDKVVAELARAGFALKEEHDFVKDGMDYFLVFVAEARTK
ncbi:MAG: methyltransferase domain-containing protein [Pyrinomonadaceae bacterium]